MRIQGMQPGIAEGAVAEDSRGMVVGVVVEGMPYKGCILQA